MVDLYQQKDASAQRWDDLYFQWFSQYFMFSDNKDGFKWASTLFFRVFVNSVPKKHFTKFDALVSIFITFC